MPKVTLRPRSKSWQIDYTVDGKRYKYSIGKIATLSAAEAESVRAQKQYELDTGIYQQRQKQNRSKRSFELACMDYLHYLEHIGASSLVNMRCIVFKNFLPFYTLPVSEITSQLIEQYTLERLKSVKRSSVNRELAALRAILNREIDRGTIDRAPKIKKLRELDSKPPSYYTQEQLNALYKASPDSAYYWKFMANTGVRIGEFIQLQWTDVRDDNTLLVKSTEQARTKSGKYRIIPINNSVAECLSKFREQTGNTLYISPQIKCHTIQARFRRVCDKANITPRGIHTLRHTFISHLILSGVSMRVAQELAGHASITTTERYSHLDSSQIVQAVAKINL